MRLRSVIPRSRERADEESPALCSRLLSVWGPSGFALGMTGVFPRALFSLDILDNIVHRVSQLRIGLLILLDVAEVIDYG